MSGTNYAVGNYAPQLAKQLRLSSTEINAVLMAGNLGVYISGPIWGNLVDSYGPRLNLACAAVLLLSGYLGIRAYYTDVFAYTRAGRGIMETGRVGCQRGRQGTDGGPRGRARKGTSSTSPSLPPS